MQTLRTTCKLNSYIFTDVSRKKVHDAPDALANENAFLTIGDYHIMGLHSLCAWAAADTFQDILAVSRFLFVPQQFAKGKVNSWLWAIINFSMGRVVTLSCKCFVNRGTTQRKAYMSTPAMRAQSFGAGGVSKPPASQVSSPQQPARVARWHHTFSVVNIIQSILESPKGKLCYSPITAKCVKMLTLQCGRCTKLATGK